MTALSDFLKKRILTEGPISVADFMADALGHPKYGYYITRDPLGADGDFTTAPEVSQMFGELIGLWFAENWRMAGAPEKFALAELGPGRGTLMADLLRAASKQAGFTDAAEIWLIETSPTLREKQKHTLDGYDVKWGSGVADIPDLPIFLIANEFFDALPVRQLIRGDGQWHERLVTVDETREKFTFMQSPGASGGSALIPDKVTQAAKTGDIAEVCPAGLAIAGHLGRHLSVHGGIALAIDYGYGTSQVGDSLQALKKHNFVDPLAEPGEADITTHVDFDLLAKAHRDAGASPAELLTQGNFLRMLGIETRAAQLAQNLDETGVANITIDLNRLVADDQMGELFKVLVVTAGG